MIAYSAILATAIAAFAGAPLSAAVAGALVLFIISIAQQRGLATRFAAVGAAHMLPWAACQSAANAILATSAAYAAGVIAKAISGL